MHLHTQQGAVSRGLQAPAASALGTVTIFRRHVCGARSALDGVTGSNTYALEKCLNWRGLLIEASPESYAKLQVSGRKAAKVHTLQCALGLDMST